MKSLKVMTWNILFGGQDRFHAILQTIATQQPDLLVLQECLDWDDKQRLFQTAEAMNVPTNETHAILGQARPRGSGCCYHVAVLSRFPIQTVEVHNNRHFVGHCMVHIGIEPHGIPLHIVGTHLDSHHENLRFVEARYLRSWMDPENFQKNNWLLMGDLNSLSEKDPYPSELPTIARQVGIDKYGYPPRFEVIAELENFGWLDTLHHTKIESWVSAHRERGGVSMDCRVDYIFASPPMIPALKTVEIIPANGASDHNAVVANFDLEQLSG
jgi:exodeoxyribonuclease III